MNKYNNGKIYTIRCRVDNNLIYVGSTLQPLSKRWNQHKTTYNKPNIFLYQKFNELGVDNFYIELYENVQCENKEQLRKREGEVIREIGTLNMQIAGRTQKEYIDIYRLENKEKIAHQTRLNYEKNKEKQLAKQHTIVICECGCQLRRGNIPEHKRSKKHKELMNAISTENNN